MSYELSADYVAQLKQRAETLCWSDDPELMVDDYAGGNIDDAYQGGERAGDIQRARSVLDALGVDYIIPED